MTHAYSEYYLDDAMRNLGEAFDFARNVCILELDDFLTMMISSGIATQFGRGVPKYVCGMSGTELVLEVLRLSDVNIKASTVQIEYDCSPDYWCGWIVAYFQWHTGRSFKMIHESLSMKEIHSLYHVLHEASEDRALDALEHFITRKALPTRLQSRRKNFGFTQRELSEKTGVNIRTLQQYERRYKNINKAAGDTLRSLANALSCQIEDLL